MIRDVDIREISDGKLYRAADMVRADTGGCSGCSRCCREMRDTIILDPMDVYRISRKTGRSFDELAGTLLELTVQEGLILPVPAAREGDGACVFLNADDRCSIHDERPGFCRLFPLGRYYQGDDFLYFLQVHECTHPRTKIRVKRWLEIPDLASYEAYIRSWHALVRRAVAIAGPDADETLHRQICMYILELFYRKPYAADADFYLQFDERAQAAMETFR